MGEYNHERLHASLNYLTPSGYLWGSEDFIKRLEDLKTTIEIARIICREKPQDIQEQNQSSVGSVQIRKFQFR